MQEASPWNYFSYANRQQKPSESVNFVGKVFPTCGIFYFLTTRCEVSPGWAEVKFAILRSWGFQFIIYCINWKFLIFTRTETNTRNVHAQPDSQKLKKKFLIMSNVNPFTNVFACLFNIPANFYFFSSHCLWHEQDTRRVIKQNFCQFYGRDKALNLNRND